MSTILTCIRTQWGQDMIKYAYNTLVYAGEPIEVGIKRLARFGYDGVEFVGEPDTMDAQAITEQLKRSNIKAAHICSIYTPQRDLVSSTESVRRAAVAYVKSLVDFSVKIGAESIGVTPTACMKIHPEADLSQEWAWAVEGIREAGKYAGDHGIQLTLEPWNRYETYLVNRLDQSRKMVDEIGLASVGCMGDTYHMNIEETDIATAFRAAGKKLYYVHVADSNRAAPGRGHIDFRPVAKAFREIGYDGYLSMELLPAAADPFMVLTGARQDAFYDQYTGESITFLRKLFAEN